MLLLSALEKTSLLISICHPASLCPTNRLLSDLLHHQSALAPTRLPNISQPASLSKTDTGQGPLHLGALAGIPLSLDISPPASLAPTGTDLLLMLVPTLLLTDILQKAKPGPTDLNLLWPPTPALLLYVDRDAIVLLVGALLLVLITLTDHLWTYTQKRESYQKIKSVLLLSPTKLLVNNRETMSGIRSYMGWSNIPELDSATTGSDDNSFSGPKSSTPGKVSVQMPTEEWLCKKLSKLNVTLVEGYPS